MGFISATYLENFSSEQPTPTVGVLPSGSLRGIPRRVLMSRDSSRSECIGARNNKDLDRFRPPERNTLRPVWWFVFPLVLFDCLEGSLLALI